MNNNQLAIIPVLRVVKGRESGGATASATCMEGGSGEGMFVAHGSNSCLRVYTVSLREGSDNELSTEVMFTESTLLEERDDCIALVCGIHISSGGTQIDSTRTVSSITVWEMSSTTDAEGPIELSHQLKGRTTSADESQDLRSTEFLDDAPVCLLTGRIQNNNLLLLTYWERSFSSSQYYARKIQ